MIEIERKFLIKSDAYKQEAVSKERIVQGFLNTHEERTVRIRITGDFGYLTIKGKSNASGTSRFEWEKELLVADAKALLELCEKGIIDKTRYRVPKGQHIFEIDEFHGENDGLVIGEIELTEEVEHFEHPDWLGDEVTGDVKYYNSKLSKNPFKTWYI
ncbi:CYTH domain-containing protein [Maribacter sp. 2307UL18-2]|uniref:CYTH domain-containing protein n=1 Tax=Maribacter sp. 2307UL18-2 TaxID=3386274 RepID=UPI0039BC8CD0